MELWLSTFLHMIEVYLKDLHVRFYISIFHLFTDYEIVSVYYWWHHSEANKTIRGKTGYISVVKICSPYASHRVSWWLIWGGIKKDPDRKEYLLQDLAKLLLFHLHFFFLSHVSSRSPWFSHPWDVKGNIKC